ncbi:MAG: TRAP transporter substrate-binding protein, partial [Oscillospiraceae bacterium]|nr:TRAP transporter substrate-binding protein [Oscillospiraceae bacterium]
MKKRILSVLALVLACAMALSACGGNNGGQQSGGNNNPASTPAGGGSAPADDGTVYKLSIARNLPESDPACIGDAEFARLLEEKSGGRFDVTLYLNSSVIANDTEALEKVADGTIQFTSTTAATCASYAQIPELNVFNEPMMFETEDEIWTLAESDYMKDFYQKFQDATGVIISPKGFSMGWYGVGTVKQDITDMGALKGLKLRVANVPQQLSMVEAMGAAPTSINWNEIFTTLQQGTVDGILLTSGLLYNNGFYETLSYYKNTRICSCYHMFIVNAEWYNSL